MKRIFLFIALIADSSQITCAAINDTSPSINLGAFHGFTITKDKTALDGYEYTIGSRTSKLEDVAITSCKQAINYDINNINEFEYFRFKLLLISCNAINKYKTAESSSQRFFSLKLSNYDYKNFPALGIPYLSKTEYNHRKNKTIQKAFKEISVSSDKNGIKVLTKNNEFYIHVLARGDFNGDKIEDLLLSSEWYARHAHGKHTDLVILSKTGKNKPITIEWRLNKPE